MAPRSEPLRAGVVGGGLGGLAVAAALRQQGHAVQCCSSSVFF
jgi:phytoene dehydrogenase-like protein